MLRRRHSILLAVGLLAPIAIGSSPAAAALAQDLQLSVNHGAPGTEIVVSSASCVSTGNQDAYLDVEFLVGTAPNEKLAGVASADAGTATITVPDWVDPNEPGSIEATCFTYDDNGGEDLTYTPMAFDIEPGVGAPVQVVTLSRTSMLAGQGFKITGTNNGCGSIADPFAAALVVPGTDMSGRDLGDTAGEGFDLVTGDSFELLVAVTNAYTELGISQTNDDPPVIDGLDEIPMNVPPGTYTVFTYCIGGTTDQRSLFFEPTTIEITGTAPTSESDLVVPADSRSVTYAGTSCTAGNVTAYLDGQSLESILGPEPFSGAADERKAHDLLRKRVRTSAQSAAGHRSVRRSVAGSLRRRGNRLLVDGTESTVDLAPDAGAWTYTDQTDFDQGVVYGAALCGDPLEDGFFYDPQIARVDVALPPVTTTTTTTTAVPPPPANAVQGSPTFAG